MLAVLMMGRYYWSMAEPSSINQYQMPQPLDYEAFQDFVVTEPSDVVGITQGLPDRIFSMIERGEQGLSIGEVIDLLTGTESDELPPRDTEWLSGVVRPLMQAMVKSGDLVLTPVFVPARLKGHPKKKGDPHDIINGENRLKRAQPN